MEVTVDERLERLDQRSQRLANAAAVELLKAVVPGLGPLPAGATTNSLESWAAAQFGPGAPMPVSAIDPREAGAQPPRLTQYPVGTNLNLTDGEKRIPFATLRDVADAVDIIRQCIEVRKDHMTQLEWGISISERAMKRIRAEDPSMTPGAAAKVAREKYAEEVARVEDFWVTPDRLNGLDFDAWLGQVLEDMFVVDAIAIYPHPKLGAGIHSLEVIDGATIKPLRNRRGGRPAPPHPAYQQILYGFPRGEWVASSAPDDSYTADSLVYRARNARSWTPYGFSHVEQAISVSDLYLKRTEWLRTEFTDGVMPEAMFETDASNWSPSDLIEYETMFNNLLSGQTAERKRARFLPQGVKPVQVDDWAKKYSPEFDDYLIKLVCAVLSVMPTEIGFAPKGGIGGKGHQEGEENTTYRKDYRPTVKFLEGILTSISIAHLGLPPALQFRFTGYEIEDQKQIAEQVDLEIRNGTRTLNDALALRGAPLYDFEEADTPFIMGSEGPIFLPGAIKAQKEAAELAATAALAASAPPAEPTTPTPEEPDEETTSASATPDEGDETGSDAGQPEIPDGHIAVSGHTRRKATPPAAKEEAQKFLRFVTKRGSTSRPFTFEHVDEATAGELNKAAAAGDVELVKQVVADLGKGRPR